jgi:putative hemolysin
MLWAGIAKYLVENDIRSLIGCVSIHGISNVQAARLAATFKRNGFWHPEFSLNVQPGFESIEQCDESDLESLLLVPQDPTRLLPPLMKGYVNLGAKICGGPAYDKDFHCHDFLMLLDYSEISPRYFNSLVKPLVQRGMLGNMLTM